MKKIFLTLIAVLIVLHLCIVFGGKYFLSRQDICEAELKKIAGQTIFQARWYESQPAITIACTPIKELVSHVKQ